MPNEIDPSDPVGDQETNALIMEELVAETAASPGSASVKRRLLYTMGATALGPVTSLILQLVSVPVFLRWWGPQLYGEWLVLSAIPTYLAMSDMGFGAVSGNDMIMRTARKDIDGALETFQSTWKLITLVSLGLMAVVVPLLFLLPLEHWLHLRQLSTHAARVVLILLAIDSLACLQTSFPVSAFRAVNLSHYAPLSSSVIRITEGVSTIVVVLLGGGPVGVAISLLTIRGIGNICLLLFALHTVPWLRFGFRHATWTRVRELAPPALSLMALPAANALNLQGSIVAIGVVLGPVAVSMFAPLRTASRAILQFSEVLKNGAWPELSAAYGGGNLELARKLHRMLCQVTVLCIVPTAVFLILVGPWVLLHWTHGRIPIDLPTFYLLMAGVVVSSVWNASSTVPLAANMYSRMALQQVGASVAALLASVLLMRVIKLPGAGAGLLAGEVIMLFTVIPASLKIVGDSVDGFLRSIFDVSALAAQMNKMRLSAQQRMAGRFST